MRAGEGTQTRWQAFTWRRVMAYSQPSWAPVESEPFTQRYDFDTEQAAIDAARRNSVDGKILVVKAVTTYTIAREENPA